VVLARPTLLLVAARAARVFVAPRPAHLDVAASTNRVATLLDGGAGVGVDVTRQETARADDGGKQPTDDVGTHVFTVADAWAQVNSWTEVSLVT
jgi:hypothetical protein